MDEGFSEWTKWCNNKDYFNPCLKDDQLIDAFIHFTYHMSRGTFMLMDV